MASRRRQSNRGAIWSQSCVDRETKTETQPQVVSQVEMQSDWRSQKTQPPKRRGAAKGQRVVRAGRQPCLRGLTAAGIGPGSLPTPRCCRTARRARWCSRPRGRRGERMPAPRSPPPADLGTTMRAGVKIKAGVRKVKALARDRDSMALGLALVPAPQSAPAPARKPPGLVV